MPPGSQPCCLGPFPKATRGLSLWTWQGISAPWGSRQPQGRGSVDKCPTPHLWRDISEILSAGRSQCPSWREPQLPTGVACSSYPPDVASFPPEPCPCPLVVLCGSAAIETACSALELSVSLSGPGIVVIISPGGFEGLKPGWQIWKTNLPPPKIKSKG